MALCLVKRMIRIHGVVLN